MKVFTDEFIEAREKFENDLVEAINQWAMTKNSDSLIECRILSLGDSNKFGNAFFVNPLRHTLNVEDEIYSRKATTEEISKKITKAVIEHIESQISKVVEESTSEIKSLKDVFKRIKVVIEGDFYIKNDLTLDFSFDVQEV